MLILLLVLAAANLDSPITWAVIIGWILTVVLHEWAHGFVAHLGGDYTIRERGGLSLNPLQYVDPVFSIIIPVVILAVGGVPLPGGVTYVNRELLRSRAWSSAVSAAGPLANFIIFIILSLPFHPALGWIDTSLTIDQYRPWQIFLAALAQLQLIAVVLNLMPVPPLDGFQILSPYMDERTRTKLTTPPVSTIAFLAFFLIIWRTPGVFQGIYRLTHRMYELMGFDYQSRDMLRRGFNLGLFGSTD